MGERSWSKIDFWRQQTWIQILAHINLSNSEHLLRAYCLPVFPALWIMLVLKTLKLLLSHTDEVSFQLQSFQIYTLKYCLKCLLFLMTYLFTIYLFIYLLFYRFICIGVLLVRMSVWGCWISWTSRSYRQLWVAIWMLGLEVGLSRRAVSGLTAEQSLQPYLECLKCVYMCMWCVHACGSHISSRGLLSCPPPYFLSFIYSFVYVNGCVHVTVYVWKSEDSMQVLELPGFSDLKLCLCLENLFQAGDRPQMFFIVKVLNL